MERHIWKKLQAWLLVIVMFVSVFTGMGTTPKVSAAEKTKMGVTYAVHIQTYGDSQGWVNDGTMAGTMYQAKRLEEIRIKLTGNEYSGKIQYKTHIQTYGWQNWSYDGEPSGSRGQAKRLEGIEILLTGEVAKHYDVMYRVYCQTYGWMPWVKNGVMSGTSGQAKRLEGIEIKLVPKTEITEMGVQYRTHCQTYGWLKWEKDGASSGTTGQGKRLEAIEINLTGNMLSGSINYRTHVQTYGWEKSMVSNGALSGTSGQAKRLEAIEIELEGQITNYYDVYYRVHAQSYGWLGWAKNGETAGTSGMGKRLEAIQIKLVPWWQTPKEYNDGKDAYIKGTPQVTVPNNQSGASNQAQEVLALVNQQRRANGVGELQLDPTLTQAANIRAKELVTKFSHTRPDGSSCFTVLNQVGYRYGMVGENIAAGYTNASAVMTGWMNSTGHRKNILNSEYKRIGIGYYYDPNSEYGYHWVQLFSD